jgi:hypothetical protein
MRTDLAVVRLEPRSGSVGTLRVRVPENICLMQALVAPPRRDADLARPFCVRPARAARRALERTEGKFSQARDR